jgi:arginine decarboxylase
MGRGIPSVWHDAFGQDGSIFRFDLPEDVEELDCLCSPEGPILAAQELAAEAFGAAKTWFLCNGSTGGLMAALLALVQMHRRNSPGVARSIVIAPRNCHKCVVQGIVLSGAEVVYVAPSYDTAMGIHHGCRLEDLETALRTVSIRPLPIEPVHGPLPTPHPIPDPPNRPDRQR